MSQSELQLQAECFQWAWNHHPETRRLLWHVTNEMKPHPGESAQSFRVRISKAKASGLLPGVSDLHFFWNGRLYLFELKVGYNGLSKEQEAFKDAAQLQGAKFCEIRDAETFKKVFNQIVNTPS
jgi:hypothetical protein